MRESWKWRGRWYLQKWPSPRALASIRGKVRERTDRRFVGLPLAGVVEQLNPALRGWGTYLRYGNSAATFAAIDHYVDQRLAILASTKHGLRGWNWTTRFNHGGSPASASIASLERSGRPLRMPAGERRR